MKTAIIISIILTMTGCEAEKERPRSMPYSDYMCERGVLYIKSGYGLTIALDTNSKVIRCESY